MSRNTILLSFAFLLAISLPTTIEDIHIVPKVLSVKETIKKYALEYGSSEKELLAVSFCESSFNKNAKGDHNQSIGIFQYKKSTFDSFSNLMGEQLDYYSYEDQAKLTAWIWSHYPQYKYHWTCSRLIRKV